MTGRRVAGHAGRSRHRRRAALSVRPSPAAPKPPTAASWSPSASCRPTRRPASATSGRRVDGVERGPGRVASSKNRTPKAAEVLRGRRQAFLEQRHVPVQGVRRTSTTLEAARAGDARSLCRRACRTSRWTDFSSGRRATRFCGCPSDSIDYAVMEKTDDAAMIPLDAGWSDVGSWSALQDVLPSDADGNTLEGDVVVHACEGSLVLAESRLVGVVGLQGHHRRRDQGLGAGGQQAPVAGRQGAGRQAEGKDSARRPSCTDRSSGPGAATTASRTPTISR